MPNIFFTSDTHFGHANACKFMRNDGVTKLRPWDTAEEMDEAMVQLWNNTVNPNDKVYHLGDVVINRKALPILDRLNGNKVLIKGNHDIFKLQDYTKYFRDIRAYQVMPKRFVASHMPIHDDSVNRFKFNVHGHLHSNNVMMEQNYWSADVPDPRYICVCVEQTGFKPIALEEIDVIMASRDISGFTNTDHSAKDVG